MGRRLGNISTSESWSKGSDPFFHCEWTLRSSAQAPSPILLATMLQMAFLDHTLQGLIENPCGYLRWRLSEHAEGNQPLQVRMHRRGDLEAESDALFCVRGTGHTFNYMIINL